MDKTSPGVANHRPPRGRAIVVAGQTWRWRLGTANVVAYAENDEKRVAPAHVVKGVTADVWQRGKHKRTSDASLTPADVARWLSVAAQLPT